MALIERVDSILGQGVEAAIRAHHRRRLARAGRLAQQEPPQDGELWCAGEPAPREGCELEVLIDGAQALPRLAEAIAGARSHVHIAGWHITPDFGLTRDHRARRLRDLLGDLADRVDVRVLLWAGAPVALFKPTRSEVRQARERLIHGTRVVCALDAHERPMHCHHEKLVIVDDETAFVGGIDLTSLGGDRFDASEHSLHCSMGWHDAMMRVRGPAVADIAAHFNARWHAVEGQKLQAPQPPAECGGDMFQVVRTVPENVYDFLPQGDFRILEAYIRALRSARKLVYLESQFLWSSQVSDILIDKLQHPPSEDFRVVVLLPARPNNGADATRGQLGLLAAAAGDSRRFLATTISARTGALTGPLYVHAKIGIVDDAWLTVGSANLNEHSLFNDSEMNVVSCDPKLARETRLRLWSEHLERPIEEISGDSTRVIDELWRPIAVEQLERRRRGEPATHRLQELPGVSKRSMALLGPVQGLVVDG
ncbi:MAG TPA: phosphatidylserine/phosphatidylglycerophosphate/cardiolipin synthase family protein [Solirubrobacteraceae bacterium]|jgi:phosphatidylserine/phosphatidylglycerophosphate/cardiolipin synthase-like enzyme|nr:phosphatidylserine/phosphatidylglycerophosphate/cardiolipin synthase family protein [Solirubrobacteraceae bacterium]